MHAEFQAAADWVVKARGAITVILGAGASIEAGVPTSSELELDVRAALKLEAELQSTSPTWQGVLRYLDRPATGNIELLFRDLSDWENSGATTPWWADLPLGVTDSGVAERIESILMSRLRRSVGVAKLEYLRPLVSADLKAIVTLNYDALIEDAAKRFGAAVKTGVDDWDGGWTWPELPPGVVPLLKLHGSTRWHQSVGTSANHLHVNGLAELSQDDEMQFGGGGVFSHFIFGLGNKLTQEGPMPALLDAYHRALSESDLLLVVGYSFRDEHIDIAIRNWFSRNSNARMIVIDPAEPLVNEGVTGWFRQTAGSIDPDRLLHLASNAGFALREVFAS